MDRSSHRTLGVSAGLVAAAIMAEATLVRLGQTYGSTPSERKMALPGDSIVSCPSVLTNHAITVDAEADSVWPWLVQMGWGHAQWYTARWVDRLLFPTNGVSAETVIPELQKLKEEDFVPDGAPESECGFIVEELRPNRALVLAIVETLSGDDVATRHQRRSQPMGAARMCPTREEPSGCPSRR